MSDAYEEHMRKHLPYPGVFDLHEAQNKTQSFLYRHHKVNHLLCAFRWRGLQRYRELILSLTEDENKANLDFGGAASPLGLGTIVVDTLSRDATGRIVHYRNLDAFADGVHMIFSSHTLEHIADLDRILQQMKDTLKPAGHFIAHVPSFYCERWRAGTHSNRRYNDHQWTFYLDDDTVIPKDEKAQRDTMIPIDAIVAKYFDIQISSYCGDDSIFIHGRKL